MPVHLQVLLPWCGDCSTASQRCTAQMPDTVQSGHPGCNGAVHAACRLGLQAGDGQGTEKDNTTKPRKRQSGCMAQGIHLSSVQKAPGAAMARSSPKPLNLDTQQDKGPLRLGEHQEAAKHAHPDTCQAALLLLMHAWRVPHTRSVHQSESYQA